MGEERSRYQSLLSEHLHLEEQHKDLKEQMNLGIVRNLTLASFIHFSCLLIHLDS